MISLSRKIRGKADNFINSLDLRSRADRANDRIQDKSLLTKLSKDELSHCKSYWNDSFSKGKLRAFEFYKTFAGTVTPYYIPNDYYQWAEHVLNLRWGAFFLQHKCCLKYFIPKENRPITILQKIDGHIVDEENQEYDIVWAKNLLKNEKTFVRKIARGTGGGRGVKKVTISNTTSEEEVDEILAPTDIIIQKIIEQNSFMSELNKDSINTIRMLTLNINNNCSCLSCFIRIGAKGSFVDNLSTGGGIFVGVDQNGKISKYGYDKFFKQTECAPSGKKLSGLEINGFDRIKDTIISFHRRIPFANLIAWDIAINKDGVPIIIEINLDSGEIECHQIFNGPVFGERTQEVMDYIKMKEPSIKHAIITY